MTIQILRALLALSILAGNCQSDVLTLKCYQCKTDKDKANCKIVDDSTNTQESSQSSNAEKNAFYCVTEMEWDKQGRVNGTRGHHGYINSDPGYTDTCKESGSITISGGKTIPKQRICYCEADLCNKRPMYDNDMGPTTLTPTTSTTTPNHSPLLIMPRFTWPMIFFIVLIIC